jgi:hypothetical protein
VGVPSECCQAGNCQLHQLDDVIHFNTDLVLITVLLLVVACRSHVQAIVQLSPHQPVPQVEQVRGHSNALPNLHESNWLHAHFLSGVLVALLCRLCCRPLSFGAATCLPTQQQVF